MRLFSSKVASIARDIVRELSEAKDIECETPHEVELDIESVLNNYLQIEKEASEKAKDMMQARGLSTGEFTRMKALVAEQKGIKVGDEMLDYLLDQLVEFMMHSANVDEIFAEDVVLRRKMAVILKRHMAVEEELEREVRGQLKHVAEGTRTWEVEYARVMEEIKRRKGLR
jgi:uncharacterized protein